MTTNIKKSFMPGSKTVNYLNKDFSSLKTELINFSKTYFPNAYQDFSPSSPGMMFIEIAAYVGDILSFYTDQAFNEGSIENANERKNVIFSARSLGYNVKPTRSATAQINLYQICPAIQDSTGNFIPDPNYTLVIGENSQFSNTNNQYYLLNNTVDFSVNNQLDPLTMTVYSRDASNLPTFFLLQKTSTVSSGQIVTKNFTIGDLQQFLTLQLDENNIIDIISVVDSDNNNWYKVDYLAQELVPTEVPNDISFEGLLSNYKQEVPYILKYIRTPRRFTVQVDENNITSLVFGPGTEGFSDEIVNLSSQTVGMGLTGIASLNIPFDPSNFLENESYGIAPSNTILTITYTIGGGITSNCPSNSIIQTLAVNYQNSTDGLTPGEISLLTTVQNSFKVSNPTPATGGKDSETITEIKQNALANFPTQFRAVTQSDYLVRVYSMPSRYGSIAKAQVITNNSLNVNVTKYLTGTIDNLNNTNIVNNNSNNYFRNITYDSNNPFSINLYVLTYDSNKNLTQINDALSTNLITYLNNFRMMSDGINIIDGYIINIGVQFTIAVYKGYNKNTVLSTCITTVQNFFNIDLWSFSQPINISQLQLEIAKVDGVQSVVDINIYNLNANNGNYSSVEYDLQSATKNNIIYNSVDPAIFECKFPNSDISGKVL